MRSETNGRRRYVSDGKIKNQNLRKKLWKIHFSTPRTTWFTEINYLEMNVQEIAFFTVFAALLTSRYGMIGPLPLSGKLSRNLISESTFKTRSFTEEDGKQKVKQSPFHLSPYLCSSFNLQPVSFLFFLFEKSWVLKQTSFLAWTQKKRKIPTAFHHWQQYLNVREKETVKQDGVC